MNAQKTINYGEERNLYGRVFEQMYTGSMRGSGAMMFAVWGYVLTHQRGNRDRTHFTVELNPDIVAFLIGESPAEVQAVVEKCCEPDPKSRSEDREGRKLVKLGAFLYEVVNGPYYDKLQRELDRRESDRLRQARQRQKNGLKNEHVTDLSGCSTGNNGDLELENEPPGKGDWNPSSEQLRLGALFKRKATTIWSEKEVKAFKLIGAITEEDLQSLETYYRTKLPEATTDIRRRDLGTLLNNFAGELDRARKFKEPRAF